VYKRSVIHPYLFVLKKRKSFGGAIVRLEPDVAEVFPNSESVNEMLRFLIRISREKKRAFPKNSL